jgi:hypothetical protein
MARVTARIVVMINAMGRHRGRGACSPAWCSIIGTRAYARWLYLLRRVGRPPRARGCYRVGARAARVPAARGGGRGGADGCRPLQPSACCATFCARDPAFRRYMFWMSLYGSGNLMVGAQLVVLFSDRLQLSSTAQILLLSVVPLLLMPVFLPWWARMFDRGHVIEYRARQCWSLVAAVAVMGIAVMLRAHWLLGLGAVLMGASMAGANLGWNLGHNDFATLGRSQHYMGVHVTLTGVRGLLAPPTGILCYEGLERLRAGLGILSLLVPLSMVTAGAIGFVRMRAAGLASRQPISQ